MEQSKTPVSEQQRLTALVLESNWIEGIHRPPTPQEVAAHHRFLTARHLTVEQLEHLVRALQPEAYLRRKVGCDVTVGRFTPPPGGPRIATALMALLFQDAEYNKMDRVEFANWRHHQYESLHPFTDGNGRSGRALWLRDMGGILQAPLGFLHHWYYSTLEFNGPRR